MQPRTLILLPALNEAQNISRVVNHIHQAIPWADVVVINDGSTDDTGRLAASAGAIVLHMPFNVGIGAAVQTGFKFAALQNYEVVIRNDGDGQHEPQDIQRLLDTLQAQSVDMVIGSRFIGGGDYGTPLPRRIGIEIIARMLSRITHQPITDPTSGFTAFNRRAIRLFASLYPHDYPEPEAIAIAHRYGLRLCEIPVKMHARQHGVSSITPLRSAYYMVKVTLAIWIDSLRRAPAIENTP